MACEALNSRHPTHYNSKDNGLHCINLMYGTVKNFYKVEYLIIFDHNRGFKVNGKISDLNCELNSYVIFIVVRIVSWDKRRILGLVNEPHIASHNTF